MSLRSATLVLGIILLTLLPIGVLMDYEAQAEEPLADAPPPYVDTDDTRAIRGLLQRYESPLPWWTLAAFTYNTKADLEVEDFDVAGFLAVMWCESSLGTTGGSNRYNNPGNIKWLGWASEVEGGHADRPWALWMNGYWDCPGQGRYGTYSSMYWGQRAAIRLIYERGYNSQLAAHEFSAFADRYYGKKVKGLADYKKCIKAAHDKMVREAKEWGAEW